MADDVEIRIGIRDVTAAGIAAVQRRLTGLQKTAGAALAGAFAGRAILSAIQSTIRAAAEEETALAKLGRATENLRGGTAGAAERLADFAAEIQRTSSVSDDAALGVEALLANLGLTEEQVRNATQAAVELHSAGLLPLDGAARALGRTLTGNVGQLGRLLPAVKALTDAQLRQGEAIDVVLDQFGGSARAQLSTFAGETARLEHTVDDAKEAFGRLFIQSGILRGGIDAVRTAAEAANRILSLFATIPTTSSERLVADLRDVEERLKNIDAALPTSEAIEGKLGAVGRVLTTVVGGDVERLQQERARLIAERDQLLAAIQKGFLPTAPGALPPLADPDADKARKRIQELRDDVRGLGFDLERVQLPDELERDLFAVNARFVVGIEQAQRLTNAHERELAIQKQNLQLARDILDIERERSQRALETAREVQIDVAPAGQQEFLRRKLEIERELEERRRVLAGDPEALGQAEDAAAEKIKRAREETDAFGKTLEDIRDGAVRDFGDGIADVFLGVLTQTRDASDAVKDFAREMLAQIARVLVQLATLKAISFGLNLFSPGLGTAVTGLASGGIVTKPTFAFLGEKGPEAVVPLDRGGIGNTFNISVGVSVNNGVPTFSAGPTSSSSDAETARLVALLVRRTIVDEIRPGGILERAG